MKLFYIDSPTKRKFHLRDGRKYLFDMTRLTQDLELEEETYSKRPRVIDGHSVWPEVAPYNACYLPKGNPEIQRRALNPVDVWLEDRWVLLRRIYGSEFVQKLFMQCMTYIYGLN